MTFTLKLWQTAITDCPKIVYTMEAVDEQSLTDYVTSIYGTSGGTFSWEIT